MYDSLPSRATSVSVDSSLYKLPRSYSHDVLPKESPSSTEADGELYVFNTPSGTSSVETQMRHISVSYDIPPTPGNTYQIPRTFPEGTLGQTSKLDALPDIPPPRPPKPHPTHDRSPVETCSIPHGALDTDSSYCIPTAGMPPSRSNTISTVDLNKLRKGQHLSASSLLEPRDGVIVVILNRSPFSFTSAVGYSCCQDIRDLVGPWQGVRACVCKCVHVFLCGCMCAFVYV